MQSLGVMNKKQLLYEGLLVMVAHLHNSFSLINIIRYPLSTGVE